MAKDIIYDEDILAENGDFKFAEAENSVGDNFNYHAIDIMLSDQGQWYQAPLVGAGIGSLINGEYDPLMKAEINKQLRDDKFQIHSLSLIFAGKTVEVKVNASKDSRKK